jgi:hypothetical protein
MPIPLAKSAESAEIVAAEERVVPGRRVRIGVHYLSPLWD